MPAGEIAPLTQERRRARARLGKRALANLVKQPIVVGSRVGTIASVEYAEAEPGDAVIGGDRGKMKRLVEGGHPAIIVRILITAGQEIVREADNPWIIMGAPLDGTLREAREKMRELVESFIESHG